jgi:hypothetical protein
MVIDAREAQVCKRLGAQGLEQLAFGVGGRQVATGDTLQEGSELGRVHRRRFRFMMGR